MGLDRGPNRVIPAPGGEGGEGSQGPPGVPGLTWKGPWDVEEEYVTGDAVGFGGVSWILRGVATVGTGPPFDLSNWDLLADRGQQGDPGEPGADGAPGVDGADGAPGADGTNGVGVPPGGTTGQVLMKASGADYDTYWGTPGEDPPPPDDEDQLVGGDGVGGPGHEDAFAYGTREPGEAIVADFDYADLGAYRVAIIHTPLLPSSARRTATFKFKTDGDGHPLTASSDVVGGPDDPQWFNLTMTSEVPSEFPGAALEPYVNCRVYNDRIVCDWDGGDGGQVSSSAAPGGPNILEPNTFYWAGVELIEGVSAKAFIWDENPGYDQLGGAVPLITAANDLTDVDPVQGEFPEQLEISMYAKVTLLFSSPTPIETGAYYLNWSPPNA